MITVVMLNFARPRNALFNLQTYSSYRIVKDILCFNNGSPHFLPALVFPANAF